LWLVGKELAFIEGVLDDVENDVFPLWEGPDEDDAVRIYGRYVANSQD